MKTSTLTRNKNVVPSLFQIASYFEDFVPAAGSKKSAPVSSHTPFADLMSHPEKLEAALEVARAENDAFAASNLVNGNDAKGTPRNPPPGRSINKTPKANLSREFKKIEFSLEAPSAKSVKLAADFTDWEKCPLEMMRSENGVWFSVVWLAPGQYSYRLIVDGQWCDDPRSPRRVPNPFGTENAVMVVN